MVIYVTPFAYDTLDSGFAMATPNQPTAGMAPGGFAAPERPERTTNGLGPMPPGHVPRPLQTRPNGLETPSPFPTGLASPLVGSVGLFTPHRSVRSDRRLLFSLDPVHFAGGPSSMRLANR